MKKKNNDWEIPNSIPGTTESRIIFPRRRCKSTKKDFAEIWRFSQDFFSPDMVNGKISCQEVHKLLLRLMII